MTIERICEIITQNIIVCDCDGHRKPGDHIGGTLKTAKIIMAELEKQQDDDAIESHIQDKHTHNIFIGGPLNK